MASMVDRHWIKPWIKACYKPDGKEGGTDKSLGADGMHLRGQRDLADEVGMVGWQESRTCPCKQPPSQRSCHSTAATPAVRVPQWDLRSCSSGESAPGLHLLQAGSSRNEDERPGGLKHNLRGRVMIGAWGQEQPHRCCPRRSHMVAAPGPSGSERAIESELLTKTNQWLSLSQEQCAPSRR